MYSILKIQDILAAEPLQLPNKTAIIEHLLTDTRRVAFPETSLFFPLVGRFHDGHAFIATAYARGIRNFLVSKNIFSNNELLLTEFKDANFLKVDSILRGLQKLAAAHRRTFTDLEVVGITGSNGKTVVKEWLFQLLREDYNIVRSPKSYNSKTGVPLSVWQIKPDNNLALFEAGISTTNEMSVLAEIIEPTTGIFTMIGEAHNEGFAHVEEKIREKLKLFETCSTILFCADDARIARLIKKEFPKKNLLSWSKENKKANLQLFDYQRIGDKTFFRFSFKQALVSTESSSVVLLPFTDTASINNAATCILTLLTLKTDPSVIAQKIAKLEPIEMRLELKRGVNGSFVVNDAYNSDFTSLSLALDFIAQNDQLSRTLILSDILQSGQNPTTLYRKVADLLVEKGITKLIGIGTEITAIQPFLNNTIAAQFFESTQLFLNQAKNADFQNQIILLKGARPFTFERIAERLSEKNHKTVLEINLNALTHNLSVFKNILRGEMDVRETLEVSRTFASSSNFKLQTSNLPKIMAMVKASAYGNGSDEVARLLAYNHVDYLAVAYADEGIELRQAGIRLPIMVMNPEEASFDALQRYDLEPEIYSLRVLENFVKSLKIRPDTEWVAVSKIHLKLDTGMHRLGFESNDIQRVIQILKDNPNIQVAAVFTHLAASEAALHDGFTHLQVERFSKMYAQIEAGIGYKPMRHVLNSSGIVRFPEYRFDMVRLGIGLYGVDSSAEIQQQLQVVQTLKATISQIKHLPKTETIGYSRRGKLERDSIIATISIGYADGLLRGAGNGRFSVGIHGHRAPIVGGVCMDMTMIDITDITNVIEGDEVEIFGEHVPVQDLANALQTIPYEVFTGISDRVKRVYFQE
ncbi:MAG: bifunctional UDP-N-acetylmuramoyl-tripeptide:D-alanyl-D-alanine ligase/alanine racemase [Saprospiraceae bacterium]|nr:bifunctional UDP-N-acetylmuramoyl-tripeptide:D-alanyl-D-alanine ligase/alanine racemase [Saprospiraceae bacterium]